jgi:hypothetical protein
VRRKLIPFALTCMQWYSLGKVRCDMSEADRTRGAVGPQAAGQNPPSIDPVLVDDEEDEAILPGMWMEGDSLAPPCQSEMALVPQVIAMAGITTEDVSEYAVICVQDLYCTS